MLIMCIFAVDLQYMTESRMWHVAWLRYVLGRWHRHTECYKNMHKFILVALYVQIGRLIEIGRWDVE
jgi:hypothetical protein